MTMRWLQKWRVKKLLLNFQILENPSDPAKKVEMENSSHAENFQSRLH